LEKIFWWLIPGHEPKRDKSDPAVFDRTSFAKPSRRYRLLDGELKNNVEEAPNGGGASRHDEGREPRG
jgi:hypothetical protein